MSVLHKQAGQSSHDEMDYCSRIISLVNIGFYCMPFVSYKISLFYCFVLTRSCSAVKDIVKFARLFPPLYMHLLFGNSHLSNCQVADSHPVGTCWGCIVYII